MRPRARGARRRSVQVPAEVIDALDALARATGRPRGELAELALGYGLGELRRQAGLSPLAQVVDAVTSGVDVAQTIADAVRAFVGGGPAAESPVAPRSLPPARRRVSF